MSRRSRPPAAGFSFIELLVVVACLGIVFYISGQLLFPMRTAAERQRLQVEARQTARAAADYLTYAVRGASDGSHAPGDVAVMSWVVVGEPTGTNTPACPGGEGCRQLAYNNVDRSSNGNLADEQTDIIAVAQFDEAILMRGVNWEGNNSATTALWFFEQGCGHYDPNISLPPEAGNVPNWELFEGLTGRGSISGQPNYSKLMLAFNEGGNWAFYQITDYLDGSNGTSCNAPDVLCQDAGLRPCVGVVANPGTNSFNAPGRSRILANRPLLTTGVRFVTFRICNGWLQQKNGFLDPATDANCPAVGDGNTAGWVSMLPNVEDMQFAYIFRNGDIRNTANLSLAAATPTGGCDTTAGVPCQGPGAVFDASGVIGIRVSVVGRSATDLAGRGPTHPDVVAGRAGRVHANQQRRTIEDHVPSDTTLDSVRRHVVSANVLIRNRSPRT